MKTPALAWLAVVSASLTVAGCGAAAEEVRRHQIDESALVPVPVGPHAQGPMGRAREVALDLRANHTWSPSLERAHVDSMSQYYLENIGQARIAVAANNYLEWSIGGDFGHAKWSRPSLPVTSLPVPDDYTLWAYGGLRGRVPVSSAIDVVMGGEAAAGRVPYLRRVQTDSTITTVTHDATSAGEDVSWWNTPPSQVHTTTSHTESQTSAVALNTAWTTWLGLHARLTDHFALESTGFAQLVPVYPAHREVVEWCTGGVCEGTSPADVPVAEWRLATGIALAATWALDGGVVALLEAHVHYLDLHGADKAVWPGMVMGLRVPLGRFPKATAAKPRAEPTRDGSADAFERMLNRL